MCRPAMDGDRRRAEESIERGFTPLNVADVVEREFVDARACDADETKVGEQIALARHTRAEPPRSAAPEQPLPGQHVGHDGCFVKLTRGTAFASAGASKKG